MINSLSHIDSHLTLKNKFASNKSLSAMNGILKALVLYNPINQETIQNVKNCLLLKNEKY